MVHKLRKADGVYEQTDSGNGHCSALALFFPSLLSLVMLVYKKQWSAHLLTMRAWMCNCCNKVLERGGIKKNSIKCTRNYGAASNKSTLFILLVLAVVFAHDKQYSPSIADNTHSQRFVASGWYTIANSRPSCQKQAQINMGSRHWMKRWFLRSGT